MKTILFYFLLAILAVSCQSKQSENTEKEVSDNVSNSDTEECIADTISATAIFWIDKAETKHCKEWGFRTVKAKGRFRGFRQKTIAGYGEVCTASSR